MHPGQAKAMVHPGQAKAMVHPGQAKAMVHPGQAEAMVHPGQAKAMRDSNPGLSARKQIRSPVDQAGDGGWAVGWALLPKRDRSLVNVVLLVVTGPSLVAGFTSSVPFAHWSMKASLVAVLVCSGVMRFTTSHSQTGILQYFC
ncbi:hypothetical protein FHG87_004446 [Trinorchestia longiramus]|nr:hypothetical protein FHG87_004446 [Trinorchestia longiramus]